MTLEQWKARQVNKFLEAIGNKLSKEVAEQWVSEQGYNVPLSVERYNTIYG